jgi:hypothetical protein
MAEYHLLNQPFTFKNNIISLALTNAIEEPILVSIKLELLTYLREMLGNNSLQLEGILAEQDNSKRIAYTNKEKFRASDGKESVAQRFERQIWVGSRLLNEDRGHPDTYREL